MEKKSGLSIGIDLGGTKVSFALVDSKGNIQSFHKEPTEKSSPRKLAALLAHNCLVLKQKAGKTKIIGVGLASAGPLDVNTGKLFYPSHFEGWKIVPLVKLLKEELLKCGLRIPVAFQNDAMAAALGEGWTGAARGLQTFAVVTLGTGIGTGIIFNGKPLQWKGMGGEFGIQLLNLHDLRQNKDTFSTCVEGFASGTGILQRARQQGFSGNSVEELRKLFDTGDARFRPLFDETALALAMLCYNISLGLHPDKILFTGGLMHMEEFFFPEMQRLYRQFIGDKPGFRVPIGKAKLGFRSGVIGAARLPHLE